MRHKDLLRKLTLEEKCSLLSGTDFWHTAGIERAGLPVMKMADGPHGLRLQKGATDNLGIHASAPATCFPTAAALASSWDASLAEEIGATLGREAAAQGVGMLLGPGLCLKRDPLCGRNFEYFSEDPLLSGKLAAAMIRGIQSAGIAACPKHFAVNNQESRRLTVDAVVDERTLREIYLAGFEIAVKEGRPLAVMSAYNRLNGVYCSEDPWLLDDILRREWGFAHTVVTDWGAGNDRVRQLMAGGNLEMPSTRGETDREVLEAVRAGELDESLLDARLDELIDTILAVQDGVRNAGPVDFSAHHALARRAAAESMVLLKNEDEILPLKTGTRVAVVGDFARTPRYQGAGSSIVNPTRLDDERVLSEAGLTVIGYKKGYRRYGGGSGGLLREACKLAEKAEVVLLYLGLDEYSEVEGVDRKHMRLPENQLALLDALHAVHARIVVVLECGSPVEMDWENKPKAILHAMLGGQAVSGAIADALTGRVNPSGRLAESYPFRYEDAPASRYFPGGMVTSEYREGLYVGYRYYLSAGTRPRYPFGFGLSYTTFAYGEPTYGDDVLSLPVTNAGEYDGAAVVQVYVEPQTPGVFRPKRTLAGFQKVFLKAGETQVVRVELPARAFQYWDVQAHEWLTQAGTYAILVGDSSEDIRASVSIALDGVAPRETPAALMPYHSADIKNVPDAAFCALLGHDIPPRELDGSLPLTMNDTVETGGLRRGFPRFLWRFICMTQSICGLFGCRMAAVNVGVALQMPYRSLWRGTNGAFTKEMLDGFMTMANGRFFSGLGGVLRGLRHRKRAGKPMRDGEEARL